MTDDKKDVSTVKKTRELSPADKFAKLLSGNQSEEIAKQLPAGINPDRFIRTAITVVRMNPELMTCTPASLFGAVMTAAKDGLLPDGKEALIQPYNVKISKNPDRWEKQAQYMPMVRGLVQVMYRTGLVDMVDGVAVREKDFFQYHRGDNPRIEHSPYMGSDSAGQVVAAYCIIKMKNGEVKREVMSRFDIEQVRAASKASTGPGWSNWYDQFAIKAVIKRAYKQMPSDPAIEHALEQDNQAMQFDFEQRPEEVQRIEHQKNRPSRLAHIVDANRKQEKPVDDQNGHPDPRDNPPFFDE